MNEQGFSLSNREGQLAVDVIETQEEIIIRSAIAGVKPEELDVQVSSDVVTIRGERSNRVNIDQATYHFEECFWGSFSRSIVLPHHVLPDQADAKMEDGVLILTIPKTRGEMRVNIQSN